jgi:hypothetical protein
MSNATAENPPRRSVRNRGVAVAVADGRERYLRHDERLSHFVMGAGLLGKSLVALASVDLGFDVDRLVVFTCH